MWADPEVVRFIGGKPSMRTKNWERLLSYLGHWQLLSFGYWAVEPKDGAQFVGDVGAGSDGRVDALAGSAQVCTTPTACGPA